MSGLTEMDARSSEQVIQCLRVGNRRRTCEPTEANLTSSRSHAILQISLEYTDRAGGTTTQVFASKLSLVDLAGSERASNTKNRGLRLIEKLISIGHSSLLETVSMHCTRQILKELRTIYPIETQNSQDCLKTHLGETSGLS